MSLPGWIKWIRNYRGFIFLLIYPIILSPLVIVYDQPEAKGAFALLLMSGYWITEVMPIYVTSLLPIVMAPLMGLLTSNEICTEYMRDSNMLFMGGAFLAVSTEYRNLHRRVGVIVLQIMGADLRMLMLGLMLPTWFLSMWMSNAASTIMMLTIVEALITRLEIVNAGLVKNGEDLALKSNLEEDGGDVKIQKDLGLEDGHKVETNEGLIQTAELTKFAAGLSLAISFASTCGGMGTVIGTPTNVVFYGMVTDKYGAETSLSFGTWAAYAIPISLLCLFCCWVVLGVLFIGPRKFFACKSGNKSREAAIRSIIAEEKEAIGSIQWAEGSCITLLCIIIFLWVSRKPGAPGWSQLVPEITLPNGKKHPLTTDTQAALLGTILFMALPAYNPFAKKKRDGTRIDHREPLLPWKVAQAKIPWGVIILIGGGFALSKICSASGLSVLVGKNMILLKNLPIMALILVLVLVGATITTFLVNAATATVLLPIMFQVAESIHVHPFYLGLPVTIASSLSFILPASTSTNAIVYGKGRIKMNEMIISGLLVYLCGTLITVFCTCSYGVPLFDLNTYPSWAPNVTDTTP